MSKPFKILIWIGALLLYYVNVPSVFVVPLSKPPLKDSFLGILISWVIFLLPLIVIATILLKGRINRKKN